MICHELNLFLLPKFLESNRESSLFPLNALLLRCCFEFCSGYLGTFLHMKLCSKSSRFLNGASNPVFFGSFHLFHHLFTFTWLLGALTRFLHTLSLDRRGRPLLTPLVFSCLLTNERSLFKYQLSLDLAVFSLL